MRASNSSAKDYFIAIVDGSRCPTTKTFIHEVANAFQFPEYYGGNYDAFIDCINDLSWIPQENYKLVIINSESLLLQEQDVSKLTQLKEDLLEVKVTWSLGPNAGGDNETRRKSDFIVLYS